MICLEMMIFIYVLNEIKDFFCFLFKEDCFLKVLFCLLMGMRDLVGLVIVWLIYCYGLVFTLGVLTMLLNLCRFVVYFITISLFCFVADDWLSIFLSFLSSLY